jgi:hypothetical protein
LKADPSLGPHTSLVLAVASVATLMVVAVMAMDLFADHALGTDAQLAWRAQLKKVDAALANNDGSAAELASHETYAAALKSRHWEGMVAVGDAYRQVGDASGFHHAHAARAKARQSYLTALFRARGEGSVDGVLRVAERFAELGDRDVVEQCIRVAWTLAAQAKDPLAQQSVRAFTERWEARALEAEPLNFTQ